MRNEAVLVLPMELSMTEKFKILSLYLALVFGYFLDSLRTIIECLKFL